MTKVKTREDLTGQNFGRWTVICQADDYINPSGKHFAQWLCECSCENHTRKVVAQVDLKKKDSSNSCGCILRERCRNDRVGEVAYSSEGYQMTILEYVNSNDILIEFSDEYHATVRTSYGHFRSGLIKNPYAPNVCDIGRRGNKYITSVDGKQTKEYVAWHGIIDRCYGKKRKIACPTYKDVTCCDEWLLFENFYKWLHSQDNFEKWLNGDKWSVDKDILIKGNKIYGPNTCLLVPNNVNTLFIKKESARGDYPLGVRKKGNVYHSCCHNPFLNKQQHLGVFDSPDDAFVAYKMYKENTIKQVAEIEFAKNNITKECYNAMLQYEVEITD